MKKFKIQSYRIGNKILYFSGKCGRTQANSGFVIAALLLITIPANTYITLKILVLTNWQYEENYLLNVFQIVTIVIMEVTSLVFFLLCVYSDPGIIKKNLSTSDSGIDQPQTGIYNNQTFNLKFCTTCKIFRPIRGHHCKVCDVCIDILDHHCPWIANCVGYKNHKFFISLLHLISILCILLLVWSLFDLVKTLQNGFSDECSHVFNTIDLVISLFFAIFSTFLAFSLIGFLSFHYQLILRGLTTYEKLKHTYEGKENPFDEGCWRNCKNFFIGPSVVADGIDKEYLEQLSQPKPLFEKIMQASKEKMATFSINYGDQQGSLSSKVPVVKLFKTQEVQLEQIHQINQDQQKNIEKKNSQEKITNNNNRKTNKTDQESKQNEKFQVIEMQLKSLVRSQSKNEIKTQNEQESEMKTIPFEKNQQDLNLECYESQYSSTRHKTVSSNNQSNKNEQNETNLNNDQTELQENYDTKMSEKKFGIDNILKFHMDSGDNVLLNFPSTRQTLSKESKTSN